MNFILFIFFVSEDLRSSAGTVYILIPCAIVLFHSARQLNLVNNKTWQWYAVTEQLADRHASVLW